ncbi:MAG: PAS domain S-box protein, partial [Burkholderiales bacterium]|nr:PAS domain S-box protein [Phycisphaerae bacterium]
MQNAQSILAARQRAEDALVSAKEELQARERELSLIYASVSDAIFYLSVDPGGVYRFVSVNKAFLDTRSLAEEQVIGKTVQEVFPDPLRTLVQENCATACREKRTVRWEEDLAHADGRRVGEVTISPVLDDHQMCTKLIGTVHDITQRIHAEEMRTRLAAVVECSDDSIISKTLEGIIQTWNKGAQRMFGYVAEEVIGKSITILIPPDRIDEERIILSRLRNGERIEHYETVRVRKDKTLIDVSLTVSPILDTRGKVIG